MQWKNTDARYGIFAILLHWTSAALIIAMLAIGIYMTGMEDGDDKWRLYDLHKSIGCLFVMLLLARIAWKRFNITPPLPDNLKAYEQILAHITHILLYVMMIIIPITGYIDSSAGGYHLSFFGLFDVPMLIEKNKTLADITVLIHAYTAYALIIVIFLHIGAALKHHFILKDDILLRMLPKWSGRHNSPDA